MIEDNNPVLPSQGILEGIHTEAGNISFIALYISVKITSFYLELITCSKLNSEIFTILRFSQVQNVKYYKK